MTNYRLLAVSGKLNLKAFQEADFQ